MSALTKLNIKPLQDRVVVKRLEAEEKTESGIIIPNTAQEKPQKGKIVAVGPGKVMENGTKIELTVKTGDSILFSKYAGTDISIDNEEYLIMKEDDILGIIE